MQVQEPAGSWSGAGGSPLPSGGNQGRLAKAAKRCHHHPRSNAAYKLEDADGFETAQLRAAVEEARAEPLSIAHERVRDWLLALAEGRRELPPPAMKGRWKPAATRNVMAQVSYFEQFSGQAARELAAAVFAAGDRLSALPNRGRPGRISGTRELLAASPSVIVYEVKSDEVMILRVWHGKLLA